MKAVGVVLANESGHRLVALGYCASVAWLQIGGGSLGIPTVGTIQHVNNDSASA